MFLKFSLLMLGLSVGLATAWRPKISVQTSSKIQDLRGETLTLAESHSDVSKSCFDYYNPKLVTIVATYESSYNSCINAYDEYKEKVTESYRADRLQLQKNYLGACGTLSCCNQTSSTYNDFKCAARAGNDGAKIFYDISANATELAEKSKTDYNLVETNKSICVNEAERQYVESTTLCYTQLNECLLGKGPSPEISTGSTEDTRTYQTDITTTTRMPATTSTVKYQ